MSRGRDLLANVDDAIELLGDFPDERLSGSFAWFDLPSGEFPESGKASVNASLSAKDAAVLDDDRADDPNLPCHQASLVPRSLAISGDNQALSLPRPVRASRYRRSVSEGGALEQLTALRQYQGDGRRAPHKPLLVLLALGQMASTGSSTMPWSVVQSRLGDLLAEFGTASNNGASSAAYPFTRLRGDGVWQLSRDVPNDNVGPLNSEPIDGHFTPEIEKELLESSEVFNAVARSLVESQFPLTIAPDVLTAVGLDPDSVFASTAAVVPINESRKRDANWRRQIVAAWDRSCAICGYDGALHGAPVGIEAAHIRWFNFGGPDSLDNGLALCSLHHKLLDRGAMGLDESGAIFISDAFSAVGDVGRAVYSLHGRELRPRPGTALPAAEHVLWHRQEVFKGKPLSA